MLSEKFKTKVGDYVLLLLKKKNKIMPSLVCYPESNCRSSALQCKRKGLQRTK